MENASKALIIAGSILIAIVLVTVGVIVVQNLNPADATQKLDEQAVQAFNSKFDGYMGQNVSGTNVRSLITAVISNNNSNSDDSSKLVSVEIVGGTAEGKYEAEASDGTLNADFQSKMNTAKNKIGTGKRYKVEVTDTQTSGVTKTITITEITKTK